MSDVLNIEAVRRRGQPRPGGWGTRGKAVFFDRHELDLILQVYSRHVMDGHWRDYAIGADADGAVFTIYGAGSDLPLYRIQKRTTVGGGAGGGAGGGRGQQFRLLAPGKPAVGGDSLRDLLRHLPHGRLRLVTPA